MLFFQMIPYMVYKEFHNHFFLQYYLDYFYMYHQVSEVKIGDRVVGYVRETENFAVPKQQAPTKSVEEIEAEINELIDGKGEAKPGRFNGGQEFNDYLRQGKDIKESYSSKTKVPNRV
jgi:hypothetical protein